MQKQDTKEIGLKLMDKRVITMLVIGILTIIIGYSMFQTGSVMAYFMIPIGGFFTAFCIWYIVVNRNR